MEFYSLLCHHSLSDKVQIASALATLSAWQAADDAVKKNLFGPLIKELGGRGRDTRDTTRPGSVGTKRPACRL